MFNSKWWSYLLDNMSNLIRNCSNPCSLGKESKNFIHKLFQMILTAKFQSCEYKEQELLHSEFLAFFLWQCLAILALSSEDQEGEWKTISAFLACDRKQHVCMAKLSSYQAEPTKALQCPLIKQAPISLLPLIVELWPCHSACRFFSGHADPEKVSSVPHTLWLLLSCLMSFYTS